MRGDKGDTNEAGNVNTTKQGIANKDVNAGRPIKNWRKSNLLAGAGIIGRATRSRDPSFNCPAETPRSAIGSRAFILSRPSRDRADIISCT